MRSPISLPHPAILVGSLVFLAGTVLYEVQTNFASPEPWFAVPIVAFILTVSMRSKSKGSDHSDSFDIHG